MIVTFCGHSHYFGNAEDEKALLSLLEKKAKREPIEFFLGEYGGFDQFAYRCAKKFKVSHPDSRLVFVSPYIGRERKQDDILPKEARFDLTLYPPIEHIPPRYAIIHRNRWMIDQADLVIAYVIYRRGGAYASYRYAKSRGKELYNLAPDMPDANGIRKPK